MSAKPKSSFYETIDALLKILLHAKAHWFMLFLAMLAMAGRGAARGWYVLLTRDFMDKALMPENMQGAYRIASYFVGLGILTFFSDVIGEYMSNRFVISTLVDIRNRTCSNLIRQTMSFFNKQRTGDLMSRLTNDMGQLQRVMESVIVESPKEVLEMIATISFALYVGGKMALWTFIVAPLFGIPLVFFGKRVRGYSRKVLDTLADLVQAIHQMFTGIRVVKAFKMETHEDEELDRVGQQFIRRSLKVVVAKSLIMGGLEMSLNVAMAAMVISGTYHVAVKRDVTPGEMGGMGVALALVYKPVKVLSRLYTRVLEYIPGVQNVFRLAEAKPEIVDDPEAIHLDRVTSRISFEGVWFAYDTEPVLRNINLDVRAGQTIALVGPTGAGKSTLLDLVARFYDPAQGRITIDGVDLRKIRHSSIMDQIAVVSQEPFLFRTTIRENIRYGRPGATDGEIMEAARMAQMHDFIVSLPQRYETEIGERGSTVSGGQRQRITIARALIKNASILLLDEATSSLDTETERLVQAALAELMKGKTTFVIAHRLSTVLFADQIVVLEHGEIVETGTHQELLARGGLYKRHYDMQFAMSEAG